MSRTALRTTTALALVGLLALNLPAQGVIRPKPKPRPVRPACNLLTDAKDLTNSPSLDIVSADVATGPTRITWVIRVVDLSSTADPSTTGGRQWSFGYTVDTKTITNTATDGPLGPLDRSGNGATVELNKAKNEIRYTYTLSKLSAKYGVNVVPGVTKISNFQASSSGLIQPLESGGIYQNLPGGDEAGPAGSVYPAGKPSCIGTVA